MTRGKKSRRLPQRSRSGAAAAFGGVHFPPPGSILVRPIGAPSDPACEINPARVERRHLHLDVNTVLVKGGSGGEVCGDGEMAAAVSVSGASIDLSPNQLTPMTWAAKS